MQSSKIMVFADKPGIQTLHATQMYTDYQEVEYMSDEQFSKLNASQDKS